VEFNYGCNLTIPRLLDCFDNPPASANAESSNSNVTSIVGGVAGGVFFVVILVAAVFYYRRKYSKQSSELEPILHSRKVEL